MERLAAGMKSSVEMVVGAQGHLMTISAYVTTCRPAEELEQMVDSLEEGDELVILTDVLGGSVNNEASQFVNEPGVFVVTGMKRPRAYAHQFDNATPTQQLIDATVAEARSSSRSAQRVEVRGGFLNNVKSAVARKRKHAGRAQSKGIIMIALFRVDHRLLHGQVVFSWTSALKPDCILVADDVACDELRKTTRPVEAQRRRAVIKSIDDSIAAINGGKTDKYHLMIVVSNVADATRMALASR